MSRQTRRRFLRNMALLGGGLTLAPALAALGDGGFESKRPALADRRFTSEAVEVTIRATKPQIADAELA